MNGALSVMLPYQERMTQLQAQIRPLAREVVKPGCTGKRKEQLLASLIPLYHALVALQEELDLN